VVRVLVDIGEVRDIRGNLRVDTLGFKSAQRLQPTHTDADVLENNNDRTCDHARRTT